MYDAEKIERKWRGWWEANRTYEFDPARKQKPFYMLTMFPYPSGDRLHLGHWFQYAMTDTWARFMRLTGENVFQPMGYDSFGLPAENFSRRTGAHPHESTAKNIAHMTGQYRRMGTGYAWEHTLTTSDQAYYRWTQWLFLELYKAGMAYRSKGRVNWCGGCETAIANEQVLAGKCERCGSEVVQRELDQWYFRTTAYTDRLLAGLDALDWPEKTREMQRRWIGRSEGVSIDFGIEGGGRVLTVFTTRPETLFGTTFVALAPEHPLTAELVLPEYRAAFIEYAEKTLHLTERERLAEAGEKSGVPTGSFAVNPLTGAKIPVWTCNYVLAQYGSGAVMGVPGHDERDRDFARRFGLPVVPVISDDGFLVASGKYSGLPERMGAERITEDLERAGKGRRTTVSRLRDWSVSRQRYWGCPIPIVYCGRCGTVPVPGPALPVVLPLDLDVGRGETLGSHPSFADTECPHCGGPARRECDTLDTFVCSSWYYLRFPEPGNREVFCSEEGRKRFLPVDMYCGGPEHACMHLLYARFITMFLHDRGYLDFDEPFPRLRHQGMILGVDGRKMSKSKGNAVSPDDYVDKFGADTLRLALLFGFNFTEGGIWTDEGVPAARRFIERVWNLFTAFGPFARLQREPLDPLAGERDDLAAFYARILKAVTADTGRFMFNTAVARLMELLNRLQTEFRRGGQSPADAGRYLAEFAVLLAPFVPHLAEELWEMCGGGPTVFDRHWPEVDESFLHGEYVMVPVMVDGRRRGEVKIGISWSDDKVVAAARSAANVARYLEGAGLRKSLYVPGKIVSFVTAGGD